MVTYNEVTSIWSHVVHLVCLGRNSSNFQALTLTLSTPLLCQCTLEQGNLTPMVTSKRSHTLKVNISAVGNLRMFKKKLHIEHLKISGQFFFWGNLISVTSLVEQNVNLCQFLGFRPFSCEPVLNYISSFHNRFCIEQVGDNRALSNIFITSW